MKLWLISAVALFFISGCVPNSQYTQLQKRNAQQASLIQQQQAQINAMKGKHSTGHAQKAPKKNIKLKKVEDDNYSSEYMYPQTKTKPKKPVALAETSNVNAPMDKTECITMIGQEKFDTYTQMFGNEAASIKRCAMLKAMK